MNSNDYTTPDPRRDQFPPAEAYPAAPTGEPVSHASGDRPSSNPQEPASPDAADPVEDPGETNSGSSKPQEAVSQVRDLADQGQQSATQVIDSAKQEASMIAEQARDKTSHLLDELGGDLREQAAQQQQKVATNLRQISEEFRHMLDTSQATGTASTLVDQAAHHSGQAAEWLDTREPGDLVEEIKGFARRKPLAFLGIALGAGLLAGRITRNASSHAGTSSKDGNDTGETSAEVPPGMVQAPPPPALEPDPLPPTAGGTIGLGGVGGSGIDPGLADPGTTGAPVHPRRTDFE